MLHDRGLGGYERRGGRGVREGEEVEKGGKGWLGREWERGGRCISGMGEEGRPLWAGVIREPFMGETITGCDSGAPAEVSVAAVCQSQPQSANLHSIEQCAQPCTATHTHPPAPNTYLAFIDIKKDRLS